MPDLFAIMASCRAMRRLKPVPVPDELIAKVLRAGIYAPNGGNTQKWRFLVVKDPKIKKAVQVIYKKAYDEVIGPRYSSSEPPPGSDKEKYRRQHAAVEYLTEHYHEDRKSTRLNSSHVEISYAVFCDSRQLHSFPTRRSSDLPRSGAFWSSRTPRSRRRSKSSTRRPTTR